MWRKNTLHIFSSVQIKVTMSAVQMIWKNEQLGTTPVKLPNGQKIDGQ